MARWLLILPAESVFFAEALPAVAPEKVVTSDTIRYIAYLPKERELRLVFIKSGGYAYSGFSADDYAEFLESDSLGRYFNAHIRALPTRKLDPSEVPA